MARRELRILPYKGDRDYQYYLDGLKVNGKRKRLFFKTEKEALEELKKRGKQLRKEGEEGQGGYINVLATKSKTARRRLVPIAANLTEWLLPYSSRTGRIWPKKVRAYHVAIRDLLPQTELTAWPQNGLRHSFASYHLAKHQDASKLALEMGHTSARLIFDAYREVVRPEEANSIGRSSLSKPANLIPKEALALRDSVKIRPRKSRSLRGVQKLARAPTNEVGQSKAVPTKRTLQGRERDRFDSGPIGS